jgi:hypothetical protein
MLPIVRGGGDGGGSGRRVRGFATVYITGCYSRNTPINEPNLNAQTRDCDGFEDPEDCDDEDDRTEGCAIEIRGVPLHIYVSEGSLGGMLSTSSSQIANFPVTIQMVQ